MPIKFCDVASIIESTQAGSKDAGRLLPSFGDEGTSIIGGVSGVDGESVHVLALLGES